MTKAKKSLGQNFLIDENIIKKIIDVIDITNRNILEVGPGTGNLTKEILKKNPHSFLAIEKDDNLAQELKKKFQNKVNIINNDILKINENSLSVKPLTVFGNLPYNISTEILIKWIMNMDYKESWFNYLVLMFQKEVADRIVSNFNNKTYGRLSIIANWRLNIKKICRKGALIFFLLCIKKILVIFSKFLGLSKFKNFFFGSNNKRELSTFGFGEKQ